MELTKIREKYPEIEFNLKRPESVNPELVLKFPDQTAVKFHNQSFARVIERQRELESQIMTNTD